MELKEIGKIHSPYKTVKEAPRQGKGIKGGNMKIFGRILKNVWHEKPPEHVVRSRISI